jgi:hypothetical protein
MVSLGREAVEKESIEDWPASGGPSNGFPSALRFRQAFFGAGFGDALAALALAFAAFDFTSFFVLAMAPTSMALNRRNVKL